MKATHNKSKVSKVEWNFPCLGLAETQKVILFRDQGKATIVSGLPSEIGCHSDTWNMNGFTPLPSTETVTLQND